MSKPGDDWRGAILWALLGLACLGAYLWDRSRVKPPPILPELEIRTDVIKLVPATPVSVSLADPDIPVVVYRIGDGPEISGEAALTKAVRELAMAEPEKGYGGAHISFQEFALKGYVTKEVLERAKAACETAGAHVEPLPDLPPLGEMIDRLANGRSIDLEIRIVGKKGGSYQFRGDDQLIEGTTALTAFLRNKAPALRKSQGSVAIIHPKFIPPQELDIPQAAWDDIYGAALSASPEIRRKEVFGWIGGGGSLKDWFSGSSRVQIVGQCDAGNRYLVDGRIAEGDAALRAALQESLKAWRSEAVARAREAVGRREEELRKAEDEVRKAEATLREVKKHPERCTLEVELKVAPAAEASEEQLAAARSAVKASGVLKVEPKPEAQTVPAVAKE